MPRLSMLGSPSVRAVNPVPWARSQMVVTLGFHMILVSPGVAWAFIALVANFRAVKKGDADALVLAQLVEVHGGDVRRSAPVTGTVLTFEFGLLWATFMGRFGTAFGIPLCRRGPVLLHRGNLHRRLHLRLASAEARGRISGRVRILVAGLGETVSANAWMNSRAGFTLDSSGKVAPSIGSM